MRPSFCLRLALLLVVAINASSLALAATPTQTLPLINPGSRKPTIDMVPANDEGQRAIQRMTVPDGFEIKLFAAEPLLAKPVAIAFDEQGRLFVAETHRYRSSVLDIRSYLPLLEDDLAARTIEDRLAVIRKFFGPEGEKALGLESEVIRLLEDTDRDGVADKSHLYAEGFNTPLDGIAAGLLSRRGQLWYTNIPSVWRLSGYPQATQRTEISRGYGVRFNYVGHDMHSPIWGPDGLLYFSIGDRGAHVKTKEGHVIDAADTGAVFRCKPDGSQLELFAFGLRNPQALLFTETGDLLTADNDSDHGDEERLVHVVEGGDSGWRVGYQFSPRGRAGPWNAEKLWHPRHAGQPAYLLPPLANIEDGPSGIAYYPGTGMRPEYRGALFVTHYKNGSLARSGMFTYKLKPAGATHEVADAKLFLGQALPTDVKFSPDGRLFFSDWADHHSGTYRGRIFTLRDTTQSTDPLVRETPQLLAGDWTKRAPAELGRMLAHADWRIRLEAQFELAERGDAGLGALAETLKNGAGLARLHAVWGLGQLAEKNPAALASVRAALHDSDAEVRAQAAKVLGDRRSQADASALIAALEDKNNRVKFFAAQSLAKVAAGSEVARRATPALFSALRENGNRDLYLRHALVLGLVGTNDVAALAAASKHESPAVRLGALLALRRLQRPEAAQFLSDTNAAIAREAALAINDAPIAAAFPALAAVLDRAPADESVFLRAINAHFRLGQPANAEALARHAARTEAPAVSRAEALEQLALWAKPPQRDRIVGVFRPHATPQRDRRVAVAALEPHLGVLLASDTPVAVQTAALKALQDLEMVGGADALFAAVRNEALPAETRASALALLDRAKDSRLTQAVQLAGTSSSAVLRQAALPIAARLSPEAAIPVLENLVAQNAPAEQRAAFGTLAALKHPAADRILTEQLRAFATGKIAPAVQLDLLNAASRRDDPTLKALLAQHDAALAADSNPLAAFRVALVGGDRVRGERIFRSHPALACLQCHRAGRDGGDAGPDLAGIGAKRPREYILEAIVKPNATIAPGFDTIVLTLRDGSTVAGTVAKETAETVTLRGVDGKPLPVKKSDITRRETAPSGMPEVYGTLLTKSELRDVVEFLASLRERSDEPLLESSKPRALRTSAPVAAKTKKKK